MFSLKSLERLRVKSSDLYNEFVQPSEEDPEPVPRDPFNKLPPELRIHILLSVGVIKDHFGIIGASPTMRREAAASGSFILRQLINGDLIHPDMVQDIMIFIGLSFDPSSYHSLTYHELLNLTEDQFCKLKNRQLPDPVEEGDFLTAHKMETFYTLFKRYIGRCVREHNWFWRGDDAFSEWLGSLPRPQSLWPTQQDSMPVANIDYDSDYVMDEMFRLYLALMPADQRLSMMREFLTGTIKDYVGKLHLSHLWIDQGYWDEIGKRPNAFEFLKWSMDNAYRRYPKGTMATIKQIQYAFYASIAMEPDRPQQYGFFVFDDRMLEPETKARYKLLTVKLREHLETTYANAHSRPTTV